MGLLTKAMYYRRLGLAVMGYDGGMTNDALGARYLICLNETPIHSVKI